MAGRATGWQAAAPVDPAGRGCMVTTPRLARTLEHWNVIGLFDSLSASGI
jgi:hypothetical protein